MIEKADVLRHLVGVGRIRRRVVRLYKWTRRPVPAVRPSANEDPLWIRLRHEPMQDVVGGAGVKPTRPALNRSLRMLDGAAHGVNGPIIHRGAIPTLWPIIAEADFFQSFGDGRDAAPLLNCVCEKLLSVGRVYGTDAGKALAARVDSLIEVQLPHTRPPSLDHPPIRNAARKIQVSIRVKVWKPRVDRLQGRILTLRHPVRGIGRVGDPVAHNSSVGPRLLRSPSNDFAEVQG